MDLTRLATISHKEMSDHITSRRFLLILVITCLVLGIAAANGVNNYNNALESYKNGEVGFLFFPSVLRAFGEITNSFGLYGLGAVIGIAIGFDLISGEREGKTLKTILSRPMYRDELINGKAIGGIATIGIISFLGFLIVVAILLILGIVPSLDEIFLIGVIWLLTMLFMAYSFSLALMSSVLAKTSSGALILSILIFVTLTYIIPVGGGAFGSSLLLGAEPSDSSYNSGSQFQKDSFESIQAEYEQKRLEIHDFFNMFSVRSVYNNIASAITLPSHYVITEKIGHVDFALNPDLAENVEKPTFWEIIGDKWIKIIVFIMWPVLFFSVAYVKFMRMDLR
ncbi:ABC transporter permease [Methanoplanus sp. FWC-SCC4]|uniref:ABC transporter permease n=1 Tax=Methanochimaera problematica TaxID=2609417 RepID=A0AA97FC68_9EURY|nr:ABC transporter permease subunit [Methanoplanus sp. FWC-SCC4]WOF16269.1 ABC transporter permease [Methanoplanus sp. FWC-SCC4]